MHPSASDLRPDAQTALVRHPHDSLDPRARLPPELLGRDLHSGSRVRRDRRSVPVLRLVYRVVGGCAYGIRYLFERPVRQPAEGHGPADRGQPEPHGRRQLLWRRAGEDDLPTEPRRRHERHEVAGQGGRPAAAGPEVVRRAHPRDGGLGHATGLRAEFPYPVERLGGQGEPQRSSRWTVPPWQRARTGHTDEGTQNSLSWGSQTRRRRGTVAVRVALFITCFNDTLFPETGRATVEVLERLGVEVDFPYAQTCCGQMHFNTGYQREAIPLVRRFVEIFGSYEAVVAPSGSCVGMVRELYPMAADLAGDGRLAEQVEELGPRVFELSEFLVKELGVTDVGAYYPHRVTYPPTCHSLRMLRLGDAPLDLLRNVRGIDLVELSEAEECCGFGGTFAVKNADTSAAMLSDKIRRVLDTEAEVCAAGDNSCLMHIGGGLARLRAGVETVHLAQILASEAEEE